MGDDFDLNLSNDKQNPTNVQQPASQQPMQQQPVDPQPAQQMNTSSQEANPQPEPQNTGSAPEGDKETSIWAILGLVFAFLFWPLGLVFSIIGMKDTKDGKKKGRGVAVAGLVINIIFAAFIVIWLFFIVGLAYFGVLNPGEFLPDRCYMDEPGVMCEDFGIQNGQLVLMLRNGMGQNLPVTEIKARAYSENTEFDCQIDNQEWTSGSLATVNCPLPKTNENIDIDIWYSTQGSTLPKLISGTAYINER